MAVVDGISMHPTFSPGSIALVLKSAYGLKVPGGPYLLLWKQPVAGDIVATNNPVTGNAIIKRVISALPGLAPREPSLFIMGDNAAESLDSRSFGLVPVESVIGRVLLYGP